MYMIGALAEIASGRRLFADNYDQNTKETKMGIMQVTPEVAQWLGSVHTRIMTLNLKKIWICSRPFINVYFGAAYAKCLFSCDEKSRRNPKDAGDILSSHHELPTEMNTNLHPVVDLEGFLVQ